MSDTPRTDAAASTMVAPHGLESQSWEVLEVVPADFARQLERELAEARAEGLEQARLLGMGGERECALRGEVGRVCAENSLLRAELVEARAEVERLKVVAGDLHWMARRYADGRQSYATGLFNDCTRALLKMGVKLNATGDGTIWARDAGGRAFDGLTNEEAALGWQPDWTHDGKERENERLRAELAAERERSEKMREAVEGEISVIEDCCYRLDFEHGERPLPDAACDTLQASLSAIRTRLAIALAQGKEGA